MTVILRLARTGTTAALLAVLAGVAAQEAVPPPPAAQEAVQPAPAVQDATQPPLPSFSKDQIEQLVAPIALYPDSLVAQIFMASTYPMEVVQAARWVEKNPELKDKALDEALEKQKWDSSVKSLVYFPDVLKRMNENLDWTQDLGDAVLAQQQEVMEAAQRMRKLAYDAGNLKTTPEQKVIVEEKVIRIEAASPEVVYVPAYNPTVVYGSAWAPPAYYYPYYSYPPAYWYPPGYYAGAGLFAFGVGMAIGAAYGGGWGHCDWEGGNINIDNSRNTNISRGDVNRGDRGDRGDRGNRGDRGDRGNRGDRGQSKWQHSPQHRDGVRYRDQGSQNKFANADRSGARGQLDRNAARGFDRPQQGNLNRPQQSNLNLNPPQQRGQNRSQTLGGREGGRSGAFNMGNSGFERSASNRGASSRNSSRSSGSRSYSGGSRSGGGRSSSGGSRSGGGRSGGGRGGGRR